MTWRSDDSDGGWCRSPRSHERDGERDARVGPGLTWAEERELKHEASMHRQSCAAAYLRGYEDERRRQEDERAEQEARDARRAREARLLAEMYDDEPSPPMDDDDEVSP